MKDLPTRSATASALPRLHTDAASEDPVDARLRRGDRDTWEWFFEKWFPRIYAYAWRLTGDESAAADVASEAFARAYRDAARFERRGARFSSFVYRLAHDRAVDLLRQRSRRGTTPLEDAPHPAVEDGAENHAIQQTLVVAIDRLPADQREVILLRFYAGLSATETAGVTGRTANAVRQLQFRGLQGLRRALGAEGLDALKG